MSKFTKYFKKKISLPVIIVVLAFAIGLFHLFSYLIPFTDNAFVVTNVTPVAADVSGFITELHVKNGQRVKKDQPIFTVYQIPYQLAYQKAEADYQEGIKKIAVYEKEIKRADALIRSTDAELAKVNFELGLKKSKYVAQAVSILEVKKLSYDADTLKHKRISLQREVEVLHAKIEQQKHTIQSLKAKKDNAKVNLDLTVVKAPSDGVIDNMYVSPNTPIKIREPIFSFIDTSNYFIQANFNETDLRNVRIGDKAYIILRMYYFNKVFHGRVVNSLWAAERQATAPKSQIQLVSNENEWLLLPQRFPIQIKILDPDPDYPLNPGASAYVYISTKR
ncbi:HlyD family secretion protein [Legionella fallonii]|uniref:HlyD family secretion protein n=1 Tax=Legionella fallonii LLAP-10 TaxID=1212491 RepID=A0A098G2D1_9GAMM|nr:HlyD family secretion protein [Legionella fallonii]CEG56129.1 HlyD family secretion protein [Legionella fallonii LLAP-10]